MKRADLIWVNHYGEHPAVVIDVRDDGVLLVVCGTGTYRPDDRTIIAIQPRSPTGHLLGLTKPTYFYESKVAVVHPGNVSREMQKRCPPNVFHELEELARGAATKESANTPQVSGGMRTNCDGDAPKRSSLS